MPQQVILQKSVDVWVSPDRVKGRFGDTRISIHSAANAFVFFVKPRLPVGSVIASATLSIAPGVANLTASANISLHRLTSSFDPNTTTWANQPGVGGLVQTLTRGSGWYNGGASMIFDVTSEIQSIVNGADWYGWRLSSTTVDPTQFVSGGQSARPMTLEINFSAPPSTPIDLYPNTNQIVNDPKPTLTWTVPGGTTSTQISFQVQVATNSTFTTGLYTLNETVSGASSIDLDAASPTFTALTNGQTRWWRVRVKNDLNIWSDYSAGAQFTYSTAKTLTITSPTSTPPTPTPTIAWTYSGTQAVYQVMVWETDPPTTIGPSVERLVYDSGFQYGTAVSTSLPAGVVTRISATNNYRLVLRVWEQGSQVSIAGSPTYVEATLLFRWLPAGATPPAQVVIDPFLTQRPGRYIRWQYTGGTIPPRFIITRTRGDKVDVITVDSAAAREGATQWYRYLDWPRGRASVTYQVQSSFADGTTSTMAQAPSATQVINYKMPFLMSVYDTVNRHLCLVNANIDPGLSEISDVVVPITGAPYLAQFALQKFIGHGEGLINNSALEGILTSQQMLDNFLWLRENPRIALIWQDQAIVCFIYNTSYIPIGRADGSTDYQVAFDFIQE